LRWDGTHLHTFLPNCIGTEDLGANSINLSPARSVSQETSTSSLANHSVRPFHRDTSSCTYSTLFSVRNAYTLLDFGDFVENAVNNTADPFIQVLPTNTYAAGHADFVAARLHGLDTTANPQFSLLPASQGKKSAVPIKERVQHAEQKLIRYRAGITVGVIVGFGLLAGIAIWGYLRRRKAVKAKVARISMLPGSGGGMPFKAKSYLEIDKSQSSMSMHPMGGSTPNYGQQAYGQQAYGHQEYGNAPQVGSQPDPFGGR
jgi:hypothetical protein